MFGAILVFGGGPGRWVRLPGGSPDIIPRSVPSGPQGHRHPSAEGGRAFALTGFEPGTSSSGVRCMTATCCVQWWGVGRGMDCVPGW